MGEDISQIKLIHHNFSDINHFGKVFGQQNRGSSYSMQQLARNPFKGSLMILELSGISIYKLCWNSLAYVVGDKAVDCYTFGILLRVQGRQPLAHGIPINNNCLFAFGEMEANFITSSKQLELVLVVVEKKLFRDFANQSKNYHLDDIFMTKNATIIEPNKFIPYQRYLQQIIYLCQHQPQKLQNSVMPKLIRNDLLPLLINTLQYKSHKKRLLPLRRAQIVKEAQDFMNANLHRPVTLKDIYRAISVSRRSLMYGFEDIFGIGPMSYLKIQRLNGVRQALLVADPKFNQVRQIAYAWGFWHLGHFTHDYKKMFEETPSQTLKS